MPERFLKMHTRKLVRDNEVTLISEYGFEMYIDNKLVRNGLVENLEEDIELLKNDGFVEVEK